jgi:hypothetical protein
VCWDENGKDAEIDESDDAGNGPFHANGSDAIRYNDGESIYDELQYKMDLGLSA